MRIDGPIRLDVVKKLVPAEQQAALVELERTHGAEVSVDVLRDFVAAHGLDKLARLLSVDVQRTAPPTPAPAPAADVPLEGWQKLRAAGRAAADSAASVKHETIAKMMTEAHEALARGEIPALRKIVDAAHTLGVTVEPREWEQLQQAVHDRALGGVLQELLSTSPATFKTAAEDPYRQEAARQRLSVDESAIATLRAKASEVQSKKYLDAIEKRAETDAVIDDRAMAGLKRVALAVGMNFSQSSVDAAFARGLSARESRIVDTIRRATRPETLLSAWRELTELRQTHGKEYSPAPRTEHVKKLADVVLPAELARLEEKARGGTLVVADLDSVRDLAKELGASSDEKALAAIRKRAYGAVVQPLIAEAKAHAKRGDDPSLLLAKATNAAKALGIDLDEAVRADVMRTRADALVATLDELAQKSLDDANTAVATARAIYLELGAVDAVKELDAKVPALAERATLARLAEKAANGRYNRDDDEIAFTTAKSVFGTAYRGGREVLSPAGAEALQALRDTQLANGAEPLYAKIEAGAEGGAYDVGAERMVRTMVQGIRCTVDDDRLQKAQRRSRVRTVEIALDALMAAAKYGAKDVADHLDRLKREARQLGASVPQELSNEILAVSARARDGELWKALEKAATAGAYTIDLEQPLRDLMSELSLNVDEKRIGALRNTAYQKQVVPLLDKADALAAQGRDIADIVREAERAAKGLELGVDVDRVRGSEVKRCQIVLAGLMAKAEKGKYGPSDDDVAYQTVKSLHGVDVRRGRDALTSNGLDALLALRTAQIESGAEALYKKIEAAAERGMHDSETERAVRAMVNGIRAPVDDDRLRKAQARANVCLIDIGVEQLMKSAKAGAEDVAGELQRLQRQARQANVMVSKEWVDGILAASARARDAGLWKSLEKAAAAGEYTIDLEQPLRDLMSELSLNVDEKRIGAIRATAYQKQVAPLLEKMDALAAQGKDIADIVRQAERAAKALELGVDVNRVRGSDVKRCDVVLAGLARKAEKGRYTANDDEIAYQTLKIVHGTDTRRGRDLLATIGVEALVALRATQIENGAEPLYAKIEAAAARGIYDADAERALREMVQGIRCVVDDDRLQRAQRRADGSAPRRG